MTEKQTQSLSEHDGIPYGKLYQAIKCEVGDRVADDLAEAEPRWNRKELVRMFRRLGVIPRKYTRQQASFRVLMAADEMAGDGEATPETVYATLLEFVADGHPGATCVKDPRCYECVISEHCEYASRSPRIKDLPRSERPRERLLANGASELTNTELLAILIGGGSQGTTALDIARDLVGTFGDLRTLAGAGNDQLSKVDGLGDARLARIKSGLELGRRMSSEPIEVGMAIEGSRQVFEHFRQRLCDKKQELFLSLLLDTRHRVIREQEVAVGSLNESVVHPREVFREALKESAHSILFIHNHPSGDPAPSPQDRRLTSRLQKVGDLMGIEVIDHIIIGHESYYSFAERGKLKE
ncbi:MAG: RadC family protein [Planctomycetota bacterium]